MDKANEYNKRVQLLEGFAEDLNRTWEEMSKLSELCRGGWLVRPKTFFSPS